MATDQRPDQEARERAKQTIRAAFATGAIVEADHDQRLRMVDDARTGGELAMVTRGLDPQVPDSWRAYQPRPVGGGRGTEPLTAPERPAADDSVSAQEPTSTWLPEPLVTHGTAPRGSAEAILRAGSRSIASFAIAVVVVTLVSVGAVVAFLVGGVDEVLDGAGVGRGADVQSADGFSELLRDLEEHTGDTEVYEAALYGDYAIVDVPVPGGTSRTMDLVYRGSFEESSKGNTTYELFDLSVVDAHVVPGLCDRARAELIEDPGPDCYVLIRKPTGEDETWLWAYVSNDFGEGGYLGTDLEGVETTRSTWP